MTWHIIQFHKKQNKIRFVDHAYQDGYPVGDRFLEGCMFKVTTPGGLLHVEADEDTLGYLQSKHSSAKKWATDVKKYVIDVGDNLQSDFEDSEWCDDELHVSEDLSFYLEQGFEIDTGLTKP